MCFYWVVGDVFCIYGFFLCVDEVCVCVIFCGLEVVSGCEVVNEVGGV